MLEMGHITELEAENILLRQAIKKAETRELAAKTQLAQSERKVEQLEHERNQLKKLIFGSKSERFVPEADPEQLTLFEEAPPVEIPREEQVAAHSRKRKKPVRKPLPDHLPRQVIVIEPEMDRSGLKKIGEQVTETLDYRPAKLIVIQRVRPKYVDPVTEKHFIAQLPARPIDKGIAEAGLLAAVVIEKYMDHLPIYRQVQRFKREGIQLARSTMEGWVAGVANLLKPLHERLGELILRSGYVQADETPIPVQDPAAKKGKTHKGYYWVYHTPSDGLLYIDYQRGRGHDSPHQYLDGYQGALQSDGYKAYDYYESIDGVVCYNCWAHARRYFFEAVDNDKEKAEYALTIIKSSTRSSARSGVAHPMSGLKCEMKKPVRSWASSRHGY